MATIGYARVSSVDQTTRLQLDALAAAGCAPVYTDEATSGSTTRRPGLDACLSALAPGDTLAVWRLDRLGRSLSHLLTVVGELKGRGVHLRSLTESLDTSTPSGELVFHLFGALAQFERALTAERARAGIAAARRRGEHLGPRFSLRPSQIDDARRLLAAGRPVAAVARSLGVHRATLHRALLRVSAGGDAL